MQKEVEAANAKVLVQSKSLGRIEVGPAPIVFLLRINSVVSKLFMPANTLNNNIYSTAS
jgi:hypothetical protein